MRILTLIVVCFAIFCGLLVIETGVFETAWAGRQRCILLQQTTVEKKPEEENVPADSEEHLEMSAVTTFEAYGGSAETVKLGSIDPKSGFKYQLELSTKGAAIEKATFSEFNDRDYKNPHPLVILSPVKSADGSEILPIANREFVFVQKGQQLPLQDLHWKSFGKETAEDGSQTACFEAVIKTSAGESAVKLLKTYKVSPGSDLLDFGITIENLSSTEQKVRFDIAGPCGLGREDVRADMRKAVACFKDSKGQIVSIRLDKKKLIKAKTIDDRRLMKPGDNFLWAAAVNKYFAAILVPVPDQGKEYCDWLTDKTASFYNPDGDDKADSGDETIGLDLKIAPVTLAQAGQADSLKTYNFQLYVGPKDKSLFDKNALYRKLSFMPAGLWHTMGDEMDAHLHYPQLRFCNHNTGVSDASYYAPDYQKEPGLNEQDEQAHP